MLLTATPTLTPFDLPAPKGEASAGGTDTFAPLMAALLTPTDGTPPVAGQLVPAALPPGKPTPPGSPLPHLAASGPLVEMEVPTPAEVPVTAEPAPPRFLPPGIVRTGPPDMLADEQATTPDERAPVERAPVEPAPVEPAPVPPAPVAVRPTPPVRADAPVAIKAQAPDILVDEQGPTPQPPTPPPPAPASIRPTLPMRTAAPAPGKPGARRTEFDDDDAARTSPSPSPSPSPSRTTSPDTVQSADAGPAPAPASPVDTSQSDGALPVPTDQVALVGAALVCAFTPPPAVPTAPPEARVRDEADTATSPIDRAPAQRRPAMPIDPSPSPGRATSTVMAGAHPAEVDAADGEAVRTARVGVTQHFRPTSPVVPTVVPPVAQTASPPPVDHQLPADVAQPSPIIAETSIPPTVQTTQPLVSARSSVMPEIVPRAFSPAPQAGAGRAATPRSAAVDATGMVAVHTTPSPVTAGIVPPAASTSAAMQAASPPVAGAARIVRPLPARTQAAAASTGTAAPVDISLPVGVAGSGASPLPIAPPAASREPVPPAAVGPVAAPTALASAVAPLPASPVAPLPTGLAPPVILPASQAFGAAIARALADERVPATDPTVPAPVSAPVLAAFAPVAATAIAVDATPVDTRTPTWPQVMAQRIEQLRDMADAGDTRIRLIPDALGAIDVSVRRDGDAVRVHFAAEQPATRQLLQDAQPRLHEAAEARGLKLARSDIDAGTGGGAAAGQGQQQRPPTPRATPSRPATATAPARAAREADADTRIA